MRSKHLLTAFCCMSAVGLLMVCSANAETIVAQSGFNNNAGIVSPTPLTIGNLDAATNGGGTGLGWTIPWTKYKPTVFGMTGTPATVENTIVNEGDQAVLSTGGNSSVLAKASAYGRTFTRQEDGLVRVELAVNAAEGGQCFYLYLCDFSDYAAGLANSIVAVAKVYTSSAYTDIQQTTATGAVDTKFAKGAVTRNTWHTIGFLLDMDNQTYQVGLDDDYDVARSLAAPSTGVNGLFWLNYMTAVRFDSVVVSIPEPSTLVLLCLAMIGAMVGRGRRMR